MASTNSSGMRSGVKKTAVRVVFLLLSLCIALLLGGCKIQIALDTTVREDGSGTFGVRFAADKEIQDLMAQQGGGDIFSGLGEDMDEGTEFEEGTDPDGTKWVKMSRSFKDQKEFEELFESGAGGPMGDLGSSDIQITQKQTLFSVTTSYLAKLDLATAMQAIGEGAGDEVPVDMLSSIIQFENRVTLPGSIKSHNADEVQGNTLIWRPKATGVAEMTAESSSLRWGVVGGFIGGGVVVLAVIVALIVVLTRRRRRLVPVVAVTPEQAVAAVVGSTAAPGAEFESAEGAEAATGSSESAPAPADVAEVMEEPEKP